ncbi:MAG: DUF4160 domain-containing protein [Calditrichaeota bacterium]|nr:DUF4160 domain-containing protein [Calditrichota bacterium]
MSPTIFRYRNYRFFFFSREEKRLHVHVYCADGEAKFWIIPNISLAKNYGLSKKQITELIGIVEERKDEIKDAWERHFGN